MHYIKRPGQKLKNIYIEEGHNMMFDIPHLQQGSLDAQNLHGISTSKDLQRVSCLAHCLNFLVDLCAHLMVQ